MLWVSTALYLFFITSLFLHLGNKSSLWRYGSEEVGNCPVFLCFARETLLSLSELPGNVLFSHVCPFEGVMGSQPEPELGPPWIQTNLGVFGES